MDSNSLLTKTILNLTPVPVGVCTRKGTRCFIVLIQPEKPVFLFDLYQIAVLFDQYAMEPAPVPDGPEFALIDDLADTDRIELNRICFEKLKARLTLLL